MTFYGYRGISRHDGSTPGSWFSYTCARCDKKISGLVAASYQEPDEQEKTPVKWLLCPNCADGSVLALDGNVYPGVPFGPKVEGLPIEVSEAYAEARRCMSVNAFTSCEQMCRKILMHVAVQKGEKEGRSFSDYLSYLETQGYVTPPMKGGLT